MHFNKVIVSVGLVLLVAGVAIIFAFSAQETYSEDITLKDWSLQQRTLEPQETAGPYGYGPMERGMWFHIQLSSWNSSDELAPVKVKVSTTQTGTISQPLFEGSNSRFNQQVKITSGGTYVVDITNENPFSVTLEGEILVQKEETSQGTVYPYAVPGFLITLVGMGALIFGIFKKPKKKFKPKSTS